MGRTDRPMGWTDRPIGRTDKLRGQTDKPMGCKDKLIGRTDKLMGRQPGKGFFKLRTSQNRFRHPRTGQEKSGKVKTGTMGLKLQKAWDIAIFFVCNVFLNFIDIISDGMAAAALREFHPMWSNLTILWMFAPFLVELQLIVLQKRSNKKEGAIEAFKHLPLMIPIVNSVHLFEHTKVKYSNRMTSIEQEKLEKIRMEAGKSALMEGYTESGPQLLLQIHIILCTGTIKTSQIICIIISMISLTVAACRGFYIKRDAKRADPEPSLHMMLRVLPYMMCVLLYNVSSWTFIMGVLKGWTFLVIFLIFLFSYLVHKGWDMKNQKENLQNSEEIEKFKRSEPRNTLDTREKQYFSLQAAIVTLWIPCFVGKRTYTLTLTSITSTTLRTLAFILSIVLAIFNLVPDNPFLLYCSPLNSTSSIIQSHTFCHNLSHCFEWSISNSSFQKMRVCDQTFQDPVFIFSVSFVSIGLIFSLIGSLSLHKLSNYEYMFENSMFCCWFKTSKILPCCLPSILSPIVHRSLVFTVIQNHPDKEAAEKLEDIFDVCKDTKIIASRQLMGKTPISFCVEQNKPTCVHTLAQRGAHIEEDLLSSMVANKNDCMVNVLLARRERYILG